MHLCLVMTGTAVFDPQESAQLSHGPRLDLATLSSRSLALGHALPALLFLYFQFHTSL